MWREKKLATCLEGEKMAGIVVVFDFDKTIIDVDSDNWVVDELGATDLFNQLLPTMPWNSLMDRMMKELHSQGKTIGDIAEVLKRVPIRPRVVPAIQSAHALGCDLKIVSDANLFFIETILKHLGLMDCFSEINTNPSFVDEEGRLRIFPHHDFTSSSHGCSLCPPDMCKGMVIKRIQASVSTEKLIYLGDGSGDFCSSLKLGNGDYVMPRKSFPLWDLICRNPTLIKADIHEWSDGEELEHVLLHLIKKISEENNPNNNSAGAQLTSVDCKFETMAAQALPHHIQCFFLFFQLGSNMLHVEFDVNMKSSYNRIASQLASYVMHVSLTTWPLFPFVHI